MSKSVFDVQGCRALTLALAIGSLVKSYLALVLVGANSSKKSKALSFQIGLG